MSKIETVRNLSHEQSASGRKRIQTERENQQQLQDLIDRITTNTASLTEEHRQVLEQIQTDLKQIAASVETAGKEASSTINADLSKAQNSAAKTRTELLQAIADVKPTVTRIESSAAQIEAHQKSWMTTIVDTSMAMLAGALLLLGLMIWQPQLIEAAWQAAIKLGTAPP